MLLNFNFNFAGGEILLAIFCCAICLLVYVFFFKNYNAPFEVMEAEIRKGNNRVLWDWNEEAITELFTKSKESPVITASELLLYHERMVELCNGDPSLIEYYTDWLFEDLTFKQQIIAEAYCVNYPTIKFYQKR